MDNVIIFWGVMSIVFGLAFCFAGFRIFNFLVSVSGVVLGAYVATLFGSVFIEEESQTFVLFAIIMLIGAVIGYFAIKVLFQFGVLGAGLIMGGFIAFLTVSRFEIDGVFAIAIIAAAGMGGALLVFLFQEQFITLLTAFTGAAYVTYGVGIFLSERNDVLRDALTNQDLQTDIAALLFVGWVVLGTVGAWYQFRNNPDIG